MQRGMRCMCTFLSAESGKLKTESVLLSNHGVEMTSFIRPGPMPYTLGTFPTFSFQFSVFNSQL